MPRGPHRVGAILDHGNACRATNAHQFVHIADMPTHVGQEQNLGLPDLCTQVIKVDHQPLIHIDIDRLRPNGCNRAGNWGQREGIG